MKMKTMMPIFISIFISAIFYFLSKSTKENEDDSASNSSIGNTIFVFCLSIFLTFGIKAFYFEQPSSYHIGGGMDAQFNELHEMLNNIDHGEAPF
jgi:hypothetical protein